MSHCTPSILKHPTEAFATYLQQERMLAVRTRLRYVGVVLTFLGYLAKEKGGVTVVDVDKEILIAFLCRSSKNGDVSTRGGWNNDLSALRSFYDFLLKREVIPMNPALHIDRHRMPKQERLPLSFEEMLAMVEIVAKQSPSIYQTRNVAIIQILFHCSLRVAEIVALDLSQVDFGNYVLRNVRVKGGKSLSVAFNDVVAEALENYLVGRKKLLGARKDTEPALFVSDRQSRMSARAVQDMVTRYAVLSGISRKVSPHLLRHTSVTELLDLGTPIRVVQEMVGHSSITTTERYAHVSGKARKAAVDALGNKWRAEVEKRTNKN